LQVSGKRVGIVGLGSIGSEIVKRLDAFGCTIMYNSRSKKPSVPYKYFPNTHDLAVESDKLSCALTPQTHHIHHIINRDVLLALGRDGAVVLVGEKELVKCLVEGTLGAAGLNVFENKPAVPKELFQMDSIVMSNHSF
ncbi:LOW QUALITY PROTEIN: glyoxylate/hydroxypyruvate reductase HPR3-like, partial [Ananas comosus]|uniref:LOW QUALITY PROTEIN: glyoxylate/hydroxypyruvate reductase HPR3-like n=1 Tax=Ananas comosus TaxID=4615 RepID=A0A6P5ESD2_ANACO